MTSLPTARAVTAPALPDDDWVRRRRLNVTAFMNERGLDFTELTAFMRERVGAGRILLTSSPVHGLSNATSDLDFIRIQAEPIAGARISTKIFERGHHLEVVSFSAAELARNLAELERLAALPPGETVDGFRSWDRTFEPRRKQTERIVGGITADGEMPYLAALPALGTVWARASLHTAIEQVAHLSLAEAAGETRGRTGYAINTLLHLSDALLSITGDVYTTRKWYLLRWARARLAGTASDPAVREVAARLDALRGEIARAFTDGESLTPRYAALCAAAARLIAGTGEVTVSTAVDTDAEHHELLPGAGMLLRPGGTAVVLPETTPPEELRVPLERIGEVGVRQAEGLLRAVRAGLARNRITYGSGGDRETAPSGPRPVPREKDVPATTPRPEAPPPGFVDDVTVYPGVRAGHGRTSASAVRSWLEVAWLMLAEGRAYIEDLEGGVEQPQMQQAAKLRLLEQLSDIDGRLAGRTPAGDRHDLALALEYGMSELADVSGERLVEIFALREPLGDPACDVTGAMALWQRLLDGFPGSLPDRLVAQGQRDMLVTLQTWARLARAAGLDVGLLTPFMKDA